MAKSHTREVAWTNPEVRFERTDIEFAAVIRFGVVLAITLVLSIILALWLGWYLTRAEEPLKRAALPPARADDSLASRLPPEPRLEAIDDLRQTDRKDIEIYPPRASEYYRGQQRLLGRGDPREEVEPIAEAIAAVAGKLPARKQAPPASFAIQLPTGASSGRVRGQ